MRSNPGYLLKSFLLYQCLQKVKVGSILERFSFGLQSPKKGTKSLEQLLFRWIVHVQAVIWCLFFGNWSQSENRSEIKPPLPKFGGMLLLKFRYSETVTKIWPIFHTFFDFTQQRQIRVEDGQNFCGLLRISELQLPNLR